MSLKPNIEMYWNGHGLHGCIASNLSRNVLKKYILEFNNFIYFLYDEII